MPRRPTSRYATLTRPELATLVPELLLIGQLIDRSGMAWCISAWGREEMAQIAVEEWAGASPIYTRRMQKALRYEGTDVVTIFKGLQLDIGAPPQFMDFRYDVQDPWHGTFHLDHCGALMDVEPMGESYVRSMCHDIEDPTCDATAVATNPRAQVRPVHRPPRSPADRKPHCAWTVTIDEAHPEVTPLAPYYVVERTRAAHVELAAIDPADAGASDYAGALLSDVDFAAFSHSALARIADEVCLQMHLLNISFRIAVDKRSVDDAQAVDIATKQLVGVAGIAAERIRRAPDLPTTPAGAAGAHSPCRPPRRGPCACSSCPRCSTRRRTWSPTWRPTGWSSGPRPHTTTAPGSTSAGPGGARRSRGAGARSTRASTSRSRARPRAGRRPSYAATSPRRR